MADLDLDLNATIAAAVNARIEATVLSALAGDEVIGALVSAALNQEVEIKRDYKTSKTTWLKHTVAASIREATKLAIAKIIAEEQPLIEDEIRKAFRRQASEFANGIAKSLVDKAGNAYGVSVELKLPGGY